MRVKPVIPGTIIRDPESRRPLPAEGGDVPDSTFWHRRLRSGEVVLVEVVNADEPTGMEPIPPLTTRHGDVLEGGKPARERR